MANKFIVWVDDAYSQTIMQQTDFSALRDRQEGFKSGTPAIAANVNAGLRQANLVVAAFMNAIAPNSTLDLKSSVDAVKAEIASHLPIDLPLSIGPLEYANKSFKQDSCDVATQNSGSVGLGVQNIYQSGSFYCGRYNDFSDFADVPDSHLSLFQVGIGTSDSSRANGFGVREDGTAFVKNAPTRDQDVVRKVDIYSAVRVIPYNTSNTAVGEVVTLADNDFFKVNFGMTSYRQIAFDAFNLTFRNQKIRLATLYLDNALVSHDAIYSCLLQVLSTGSSSTNAEFSVKTFATTGSSNKVFHAMFILYNSHLRIYTDGLWNAHNPLSPGQTNTIYIVGHDSLDPLPF